MSFHVREQKESFPAVIVQCCMSRGETAITVHINALCKNLEYNSQEVDVIDSVSELIRQQARESHLE